MQNPNVKTVLCVLRASFAGLLLLVPCKGQSKGKEVSIGEAAEQAMAQSKLTLPGSVPFHLKAVITNTPPMKDFAAEVEEWWVSQDKWRRTIKSEKFSQVLIANGGQISEQDSGDYYPFWLRDVVTALFDPLPMAEQLKRLKASVELSTESAKDRSCVQMQSKVGVAPVRNNVEYLFCFAGPKGLLEAVVTPEYRAQFADYRAFKARQMARTVMLDLGGKVRLEAKVTELGEIASPEEAMFVMDKPTPPEQQLRSMQVGEDSARVLALSTPEMVWPTVREGATEGVMSLYISTDRTGQVREVWPVNSQSPELETAAREQVLGWKYKPFNNNGPVQMEAVLTFAFKTRIEDPIQVLSDALARKLALTTVEPKLAPGRAKLGSKFTLRASVDEAGRVVAVQNPNNVPGPLLTAGEKALRRWRFHRFLHKGKPDRFYADITFQVR